MNCIHYEYANSADSSKETNSGQHTLTTFLFKQLLIKKICKVIAIPAPKE